MMVATSVKTNTSTAEPPEMRASVPALIFFAAPASSILGELRLLKPKVLARRGGGRAAPFVTVTLPSSLTSTGVLPRAGTSAIGRTSTSCAWHCARARKWFWV